MISKYRHERLNQITADFVSFLRLVFTSDGVVVGVVIRSEERYDNKKWESPSSFVEL